MIDYVADYLETIGSRRVLPEVKPGYLSALLPDRAPAKPESWTNIMDDVNRAIMPGVCIYLLPSSSSSSVHHRLPAVYQFLAQNLKDHATSSTSKSSRK